MDLLLPSLVILKVLSYVSGYPSGAPTGSCEDMMPRHSGVQPQPLPVPYTIVTDSRTFEPGQPVTVTIRGPDYRGVLLEARTFGSTNALGRWQLPPPDTKFLLCAGNPAGAVTHSNTNPKGNTTVYSWIPPNSAGPIYFVATVAQQRAVYWMGVKSMTLIRGKPDSVNLSITGASTRTAEENPLLVHILCFLMFHLLAWK